MSPRPRVPLAPPAALAACLVAWPGQAPGEIRINEVNIDPPGTDAAGNFEFIELVSTTGGVESAEGLALLVIDSNNGGYGRVRQRWSLAGMSTGQNGILVIGNNYPAQFPFGAPPAGTGFGDPAQPDAMDNGEIDPNGGFTLYLVSGLSPNMALEEDLDPDDDGVLEWRPWTTLVDSVGFDDFDPGDPPDRQTYALADLTQAGYEPENMSRLAGDFRPNVTAAWFGGAYPSSAPGPASVAFDPARVFNVFPGASATPGLPNAPLETADLRLNEVSINPNGNDDNVEFIELASVSGGVERADGYHLVIVANDPLEGDVGVIEQVWDLAGLQTGSNGLLLVGDGYSKPLADRRASTPFKGIIDPETGAGDPPGLGRNEIEPSNGISVFLVTGFTGLDGQDLDADNDGVLDPSPPWQAAVDSIGFDSVNEISGARSPSYAGAVVDPGSFFPDNLSRVGGSPSANDAAAWYGGDYAGDSQTSIAFNENRFAPAGVTLPSPRATPGASNLMPDTVIPAPRVLVNEVLVDAPPSPQNNDDNTHEFVELVSATGGVEVMDGLTLLVVNSEPGSAQLGVVRQAIGLTGIATGPNGLCIIGDSYNDLLVDAPVPFGTHREDPQGLNAGDLSPNDGMTLLLVRGFTGATGQDLDSDDDGVFDSRPWEQVEDAVGFGAVADPDVAVVGTPGFIPDAFSRLPGRLDDSDRSDATAWCAGTLASDPRDPAYISPHSGPFLSAVTRGYGNHGARPAAGGTVLINEVVINPVGTDTGAAAECVEILVTTLDARSLAGYSLVLLESAGGSVGDVMHIWDLSGFTTGANGLALLGDGYTSGGSGLPYDIDPLTSLAAPAGMKAGDVGDDNAFSLLLVEGIRPTVNESLDLDASAAPASDDDGKLDLQPWESVADSVGFREYDGDLPGLTGITYAVADVSSTFDPDTVARIASPDQLLPNSAASWYGGELLGSAPFTVTYDPLAKFGPAGLALRATPGRHNLGGSLVDPDSLDSDGDGKPALLEEAFGTDPDVAEGNPPLEAVLAGDPTQPSAAIAYPRRVGGTDGTDGTYSAGTLAYHLEASGDLVAWAPAGVTTVVARMPSGRDPAFEVVVVRLDQVPLELPLFLRIRVERLAAE